METMGRHTAGQHQNVVDFTAYRQRLEGLQDVPQEPEALTLLPPPPRFRYSRYRRRRELLWDAWASVAVIVMTVVCVLRMAAL